MGGGEVWLTLLMMMGASAADLRKTAWKLAGSDKTPTPASSGHPTLQVAAYATPQEPDAGRREISRPLRAPALHPFDYLIALYRSAPSLGIPSLRPSGANRSSTASSGSDLATRRTALRM